LKNAIQSTPHLTPNILHRFIPLIKFNADRHFTYITTHTDEHKQQLQSYYKLTEEDLEQITKEWSTNLLVPAYPTEISDVVSHEAILDTPEPSKTKMDDEFHDIHSTSTKTTSISPMQGGGGEELGGTEVEKNKGEVTLPRSPHPKRKLRPPGLRLRLPSHKMTSTS
jgi:hypothetical protein